MMLVGIVAALAVYYTTYVGKSLHVNLNHEEMDNRMRNSFISEQQRNKAKLARERVRRMKENQKQAKTVAKPESELEFEPEKNQTETKTEAPIDEEKVNLRNEKDTLQKEKEQLEKDKQKYREMIILESQKVKALKKELKHVTNTVNTKTEAETKKETKKEKNVYDKSRLNILLFYADDWTMNVLGKLNKQVYTPNIDKMVDKGMLFVNNCVTTSVCWISRATLATGTYYSRHLVNTPSSDNLYTTHNWNESLYVRLKNAGYHTGLYGKWHAPGHKDRMREAFDERKFYYGKHWHKDYSPYGANYTTHVTQYTRDHGVRFLENRPKDKNFFLKVSFFATHACDETYPSYQPMNWSRFTYYPDDESHENYTNIVPPKTCTDRHWKELPHFFHDKSCGRLRMRKRWEPDYWQKNIRDLYALATEVDWACGEMLDVLKKQGVENDTLVIFTTDNGDLHGEHGLAEKWHPFEESMKVPLVIQDPRMPKQHHGEFNKEYTLNVDLAPTILGAAGLDPSSFMQGRDIADLYLADEAHTTTTSSTNNNAKIKEESGKKIEGTDDERSVRWAKNIRRYASENTTKSWRKDFFYEWNMGNASDAAGHQQDGHIDAAFALITPEWKYVYWPLKVYEQLYHRSLDQFDEYDILQNYFLHKKKEKNGDYVPPTERQRMLTFTPTNTTPLGDSIQSTMDIYKEMKARFYELKANVQRGDKI